MLFMAGSCNAMPRMLSITWVTGARCAAGDGAASRPPVTQVMDSIMGMALQLPALKSIGESIGVDLSAAVGPSSNSADAASGGPASPGNKALPKG